MTAANTRVTPLKAARAPVGAGTVTIVGALLAVLVVAVGAVAIQAAASAAGLVDGTSWLTRWADSLDGTAPAAWTPVVAVVLALIGLWLVLLALKPRPRTGVAVQARTGVYLRPTDVARVASAAAGDVDGVAEVDASATRSTIRLRVSSSSGDGVRSAVKDAVDGRLVALAKQPRVKVATRQVGP
ncbi:MAG: DUF6286 domain-containing protein [Dermatophilaceae bacterium]